MPGVSVGNLALSKYGFFTCRNAAVGTSFVILNSGASATALPAYPTGEALEVQSTDNTNDKAGGTGMLTVRVGYLVGTTGAIGSEVITLNGTTNVPLVQTSVTRVLFMHGLTFGSTGAATGTVSVQTVTGDFSRMAIDTGFKSAFPGRFTIPDGYTGYYRGFDLSNSTVTSLAKVSYIIRADVAFQTGLASSNNFIELDCGEAGPASGLQGGGRPSSVHGANIPLPAGTTIMALARADQAAVTCAGRVYVELTNKEI